GRVRRQEELRTSRLRPIGQRVSVAAQLIEHRRNAEHLARPVPGEQPVPKRRTEVEPVVVVLGLDEHVGIEQVRHQTGRSRLRPISCRVSTFEIPSILKASRYSVWPSSVLTTKARAKRLPTRAGRV